MKSKVISITLLLALVLCWSCSFNNVDEDLRPAPVDICSPSDTSTVSFQDTIFPIFQKCCSDTANGSCHFPGGAPPIFYTGYTQIKTVVDNGKLQARLFDQNPSAMPPSYTQGPAISECEKTLIHRWMDQGAPNN
jgi:hypothetical protein